MLELLSIGVVLLIVLFALATVGIVLKLAFWLLLLPLRLAGAAVKLAFGLLVLPVLLVVGAVGLIGVGIAAVFALIVPLLPVALAVLVIWALAKWLTRPAVAAPPVARSQYLVR